MFFSDKHAGMGELADTLAEDAYTEGRSLWRDARRRFMNHRAAVASLVVLALLLLFAAFGQYLSPWDNCLLYTSPSPRDLSTSRMPSSA